jgi:hypothetical protein
MQTTLYLSNQYTLAAHFVKRLKETPLLTGWLLIGLLVALLMDGWMGLGLGVVNLLLLGLYVLLIRQMTPNVPAALPIKRPRLELAIALLLFAFVLLVQLLDFGILNIQPWQGWVHGFFSEVKEWVYSWGLPGWAQLSSFNAISSAIKQVIPTLQVFILLGYGRQAMGLAYPHGWMTAAPVGITAISGFLDCARVICCAPRWVRC